MIHIQMSTYVRIFLVLFVLLSLGGRHAALGQSKPQAVEAARQATQKWLALLDADKFKATWSTASPFFKSKVNTEQWISQIKTAHASLDSLRSRTLIEARYTTSLPNAPDGEYVLTQYRTQYGTKQTVETITLKKDSSAWRVAGYFVKPARP